MNGRVVIVGGGIAGLSAAHELAERGFRVEVYERRTGGHSSLTPPAGAFGGKARSYRVGKPTTTYGSVSGGGRHPIPRFQRIRHDPAQRPNTDPPGEHGFRFFPGFYRHLPDTMERIELPGGGNVAQSLISPGMDQFVSYKAAGLIPFLSQFPKGGEVGDLGRLLQGAFKIGLSPQDILFYFQRLWQVLTSCQERRFAELEPMSWEDFVEYESRSPAFKEYFGAGSTRNLVASKAAQASARIIAEVSIQTWLPILLPRPANFAADGDRVLDGPTQDVWIQPWIRFLTAGGRQRPAVRLHAGHNLERIVLRDGRVHSLAFSKTPDDGSLERTEGETSDSIDRRFHDEQDRAKRCEEKPDFELEIGKEDFVVFALPVEQMAKFINDDIVAADPNLGGIRALSHHVGWMSGIQFFLEDVPQKYADLKGHVNFVDSPWALTSIIQSASWAKAFRGPFDNGSIRAVLSVCVSNFEAKGFNGKTAFDCTPEEIRDEVWDQIVRGLPALQNVMAGFTIDEDLREQLDRSKSYEKKVLKWQNAEPLLINRADSWKLRPTAGTRIENMLLAGDYIRTHTGLACMEGANESARRAVNDILSRSGSSETRCEVWELPEPFFAKTAQVLDRYRFDRGKPWRDVPGAPMTVLAEGGGQIANVLRRLFDRANPG